MCVSRWGDTSKVEYVSNWSDSEDNIAAEHCYVIIALWQQAGGNNRTHDATVIANIVPFSDTSVILLYR